MSGLADSELLAQARPANTTAATLITAPANMRGVRLSILRLVVCNTSGAAATFRIFHDDDGTTYDESTALHYDTPIGPGDTVHLLAYSPSAGVSLKPGGSLGVRTSVNSALTFSCYGTTGQVR